MKRNLSDSDADDVFDDSSKGTPTQSNESCQMLNRKKRRGIIEKRRRDRINNSLTELRRLVPTAFEKQGSAKLEKAEILQMTVDHLKMLHAKGFDAFAFDPHKFAMDYHSIGFRECAAEVARYLVTMEGMDVQDPLRLRLMSHLQCYSAQRELASKQAHAGWGPFNPSSQFANPFPPHPSDQPPPPHHAPPLSCSEPRSQPMAPSDPLGMGGSHMRLPPGGSVAPAVAMTPGGSGSSASAAVSLGTGTGTPQGPGAAQYPVSLNISTHCFPTSSPNSYSPTATTTQAGPPVKPYRPWGAELAY